MGLFSIAISFFISLLSGLGIGGGGLFLVYLVLAENIPQIEAQGLNLLFFIFSAGASLPVHFRKRKIFYSAVLQMIIGGIVGALLGSSLASVIDEGVLKKIFGAMLAVSALFSLKKCAATFKREKSDK